MSRRVPLDGAGYSIANMVPELICPLGVLPKTLIPKEAGFVQGVQVGVIVGVLVIVGVEVTVGVCVGELVGVEVGVAVATTK
jgi:hypothetical protein